MITLNYPSTTNLVNRIYQKPLVNLNPDFQESPVEIYNLRKTEIIHCYKCRKDKFVIPDTIIHIGIEAFAHCKMLTSIFIPSSVKTIGIFAFSNCINLQSIILQSKIPIYLAPDTDIFFNVDKVKSVLFVPEGSKYLYQQASQWQEFVNIQEINEYDAIKSLNFNLENPKQAILKNN